MGEEWEQGSVEQVRDLREGVEEREQEQQIQHVGEYSFQQTKISIQKGKN